MRQKMEATKPSAEKVIRDIRRITRKQYGAEENIRIVLDGLRGEESIVALCRREGIAEFKLDVPGNYILVDHALSRAERGLVGILQVEGTPNPEIFDGKVEPGSGH